MEQNRQPLFIWSVQRIAFILMAIIFIGLNGLAQAYSESTPPPINNSPNSTPFYSLNGSLASGESITGQYPLFTSQREFNFRIAINGVGPADLEVRNGSDQLIWQASAAAGETVWGSGTLTQGTNSIEIVNQGAGTTSYTVHLYDLPTTPFDWHGVADGVGVNSEARIHFPQSGLYTFDLGLGNGRYQLFLNNDYIQKTAETDAAVTYFIPAGTHDLTLVQDSTLGADWQVVISGVGAAADSLPYAKSGGELGGNNNDFGSEWLPIHLTETTAVNLALSVDGTAADSLTLTAYSGAAGNTELLTLDEALAGETIWASLDLPAGTSRLHLMANGANADPLTYELTLYSLPTAAYTWSGTAAANGLNSQTRVTFADSGIYTFTLNAHDGRYQFQVNEAYIQKTAETDTAVAYFIPAGTHDLTLVQDSAEGADWQVIISDVNAAADSLPYTKSGGEIGGVGNDFTDEWLPIHLADGRAANLEIMIDGEPGDEISLALYNDGSNMPDFVLDRVLGSEIMWANVNLSAGTNRLYLSSNGNDQPLSYAFTLTDLPMTNFEWSGRSLAAGLNSAVMIDFAESGLYRFEIESSTGFANLMLDGVTMLNAAPLASPRLGTTYDLAVTAGDQVVGVVHNNNYDATNWSASVTLVTPESQFFTFTGTLAAGETVTPVFPLPQGERDFNFVLMSDGEPVGLTLTDSNGAPVWNGTVLAGETLWGTGTFTAGDNTIALTNQGGADTAVSLTFYHLPTAPYTWTGLADAAGENSHIRTMFGESGLYTFDLGLVDGRYQLVVNNDYIRKTAETISTVTYYIPAGTHDLYLEQDSSTGADWSVAISGVGAGANSLPYTKSGGDLGGASNNFTGEWLPLHVTKTTAVNLAVSLTGTADDQAMLQIYDADNLITPTLTLPVIYTGETVWATVDLPSGTSLIQVAAMGSNADPVSYMLTIDTVPTAPTSWNGRAHVAGLNSEARLTFDQSGLYTFDLGALNGRYQLLVNQGYIQKTVETDSEVTYYIPAGTHLFQLVRDETSGVDWSIDISAVGAAVDSLPYPKQGGNLGGIGNQFVEEWLPIFIGSPVATNIELSLGGAVTDALHLHVYDMAGKHIATMSPLYGGETVWGSFDLPATGAHLHLVADKANINGLTYDLTIKSLPLPTYSWGGHSRNVGTNSLIRLDTEISGIYLVQVDIPQGFVNLNIGLNGVPLTHNSLSSAYYEFEVPLPSGVHTFTTVQQPSFASSSWTITTTLVLADGPTVTAVAPDTGHNDEDTAVTIHGTNFIDGVTAYLVQGDESYALTGLVYHSATELTAVVPAGLDVGVYDLMVINLDEQSATLVAGYTVIPPAMTFIYLPLIMKP